MFKVNGKILPQELEDIIFDYTDTYTKYLNDKLYKSKLSFEQMDEILLGIFVNDKAEECLMLLDEEPKNCIRLHNIYEDRLYNYFIKQFHNIKNAGTSKLVSYFTIKNIDCVFNFLLLNNKNIMDYAAQYGHLETVRFLHVEREEGCTYKAMDCAAQNGHLEIIKFLHENRKEGCTKDAMDRAAIAGHLEVVKFLHFNRTEGCTTYAMSRAASKG